MAALILSGIQAAKAANTRWTWNGSSSSDFSVKNNWTTTDNDASINTADTVIIPGSLSRYPELKGNTTIAALYHNGGILTLKGKTLTVIGMTYLRGGTFDNSASGAGYVRMNGLELNFSGIINVPSGVRMEVWTGNVSFINGIINNGYFLELLDDVTVTGASDQSHIMGAVEKVGDDAFTFPVGDEYYYAPFSISAPENTGHHYTVQYFSSPYTDLSTDNTLNHVSTMEYWTLDAINGASSVDVSLGYENPRSGEVEDMGDLTVAVYDGSDWTAISGSTSSGSIKEGTVTAPVSSFSNTIYTVGSISTLNPLPVKLFDFRAVQQASAVELSWKTASETNNAYFEVERSSDGKVWYSIGMRKAAGNHETDIHMYTFTDVNPLNGVQLYRLKQTDLDGAAEYSASVQVLFGLGTKASVYPQPVSGTLQIVSADGAELELVSIYNAMGQVVLSLTGIHAESCSLDMSGLATGIYHLEIQSAGGKSVQRIIKQ